jgi:heterotetrameric sarcosine oxidase gamma subunit
VAEPILRTCAGVEDLIRSLHDVSTARAAGLRVNLMQNYALASVVTRRGWREQLGRVLRENYAADVSSGPCYAQGAVSFVGCGPDHLLAISSCLTEESLCEELKAKLSGIGSITEQGDGRVVLRLQGPSVRQVLAKGLPIDLHPRVFGTGSAASTSIDHMGLLIWQVEDAPVYEMAIARSFAVSFLKWLTHSAAEVGCEVRTSLCR